MKMQRHLQNDVLIVFYEDFDIFPYVLEVSDLFLVIDRAFVLPNISRET